MTRQQIVLTVLGIGLIVLLFTLPKVVVDNEDEIATSDGIVQAEQSKPGEIANAHELELSDSDQQRIQSFKEQLKNPNKTAIFADSLAAVYLRYQELDSVAKYADLLVEYGGSPEYLEKAGNYYYEAFGFASDQGQAQRLGNKVREHLGSVLEKIPDNLEAKARIAMTYVSSSNPMQGITMLREILEVDPDNRGALYNMGILSLQSGQYDRAVERFEHLVEVDPANVQAMFYAGVAYKELGNKEEAKKWLLKAQKEGNDPAVTAAVESYLQELN